MPFIHWVVEPKYVSRKELDKSVENELEAVTNNSLVAVLQQLASLVKCANRIFDQVGSDLKIIQNRSTNLTNRIKNLNDTVAKLDAKKVPIPVGDLTKFSLVKEHYEAAHPLEKEFFRRDNRPLCVQTWYDEATLSPVHIMRQIDEYRQDGCRTSKYFICMPVFKDNERKVGLEIETRRPSSMCEVRGWQNGMDLDDLSSADRQSSDEIDNPLLRLPSPEERTHALSLKYPYSDVPIDVTGNSFRRMGSLRRSFLQQVEFFTRKKKKKKSKNDRRNTISGGDEIEAALNDYSKSNESTMSKLRKRFSITEGSHLFKGNGMEHLYSSLRRPAENKSVQTGDDEFEDLTFVKTRLYETLNPRKHSSKEDNKKNKNNKSNIPISTYSQAMSLAVKLRNTTRGKGEDSGQSSSGNWSASSSTRTSVESENLKAAAGALGFVRTSSQTSLSKDSALSEGTTQNEDVRSNDSRVDYQSDNSTSTSTSLKNDTKQNPSKRFSNKDTEHWLRGLREEIPSEDGTSTTGTLTPLLGKRFSPLMFIDDEDSSVYSVDTDGYYTSMHTDSGLRSLSSSSKPVETGDKEGSDENGSTMSSISTIEEPENGEVKTPEKTLKKIPPLPPKRHSSLQQQSPTESICKIRPTPSPSPESDVEARDSLKKKTFINASRIPSMCIVTPNPSDDEVSICSLERPSKEAPQPPRSILVSEDHRSELHKKKLTWSEGSNTLPRSFGRNYSSQFNSWPRNPERTNKNTQSSTELFIKEESVPELPLKYIQHITVTPGKRYAQIETLPRQSVTSPEGNDVPKIIYATNSLERKKNISHYDRPRAYVSLENDPTARKVMQTNTACEKATPSGGDYKKPNYPDTRFNYSSNTLPRGRLSGATVPLFPNKSQDPFRPNTFQYATLPRRKELPHRQPSPPSPEDSSPRESIADLPPPMSLMSPTLAQTMRRWSYATPGQVTAPPDPVRRPSYLPIASNVGRPPTPAYRPPPPPNVRSNYNGPLNCPPTYQLVPRNRVPQSNERPLVNGRVGSPGVMNGPPTPQRQYVLSVSRSSPNHLVVNKSVDSLKDERKITNGYPPIPRNGYTNTYPANCVGGRQTPPTEETRVNQTFDLLKRIPKASMSTDDLFAAIHQSKKRLNIRSETDRASSPSSVRSESPSLFGGRSQIPRVSSPESGTLSPRCMSPGGRKSWSGDCPSPGPKNGVNSPGDRKSWAMDRLGVNKPTTMHDFKMLLLQASRNTSPQNVQHRKSASEMLKVSPVKSPQQPMYPTKPITQAPSLQNGHIGIPVLPEPTPAPQRVSPRTINMYGRGRSRYPFHPHTDILSSPIWEDNMEDVESPSNEEQQDRYYAGISNGTPHANGFGMNNARRALY